MPARLAVLCCIFPYHRSYQIPPQNNMVHGPCLDPFRGNFLYLVHVRLWISLETGDTIRLYSSSLESSSSSSSSATFFTGFFFFFLFLLFAPVGRAVGCSRIFSTSSSVIFLSVLYLAVSRLGGAARRMSPFFVIASPVSWRHSSYLFLKQLTDGCEESCNRGGILVCNDLVLPYHVLTHTLDDTHLCSPLIVKLP